MDLAQHRGRARTRSVLAGCAAAAWVACAVVVTGCVGTPEDWPLDGSSREPAAGDVAPVDQPHGDGQDIGAEGRLSAVPAGESDATLELRWVLADEAANGFTDVMITPLWAGANQGAVRDLAWTQIPVVNGTVRPMGSGRDGVVAARGNLPSGVYDRVYVAASAARARKESGAWVGLVNHVEPIARGLQLRQGGHAVVTIELIVRPASSAGDGRDELFVRDAQLAGDSTSSGDAAWEARR